MTPLKLAVIGTGHLGRIHARLAATLDDATLIGVVDPDRQARQQVASDVGAQAYPDHHDLLDQIDAAIIATPTVLHHQIAADLIRHGIHVLVEKPLTTTVEEADSLVTLAERHKVVFQVGHVERFNPALSAVLPHLHQPKYIEAARVSGYPFRSTDVGVVMDLMIHDLDVVLSLVDSPVRTVEALGVSVLAEPEDVAQARLVFENGCVANLTASRASYAASRTMQVWMPTGFASIDFGTRTATLVEPSESILHRRFDPDALSADEKTHLKEHLFDEVLAKRTIEPSDANAILDEHRDFVHSIRTGESPRVTGRQGRDAVAVAHQILESIAQHQWDGHAQGPKGPMAMPVTPSILPLPQQPDSTPRREAG